MMKPSIRNSVLSYNQMTILVCWTCQWPSVIAEETVRPTHLLQVVEENIDGL
jgi:hypothetical protein